MVTHDARAAAIADRVLFLADGQIVRDLPALEPARDLGRRWSELASRSDQVRAEGPARPQAPDGADRDRDRPRRRDGQRHLRPHRLDRQGVRLDLHRGLRGHRRRDHRQVRVRLSRASRHDGAAVRRVAAREGPRRRRTSAPPTGSVGRRGAADRQGRQGDRLRRRAEPRLQRSTRRRVAASTRSRSSRARGPGPDEVVDRHVDRRQEGLRGRRHDRRRRRAARSSRCAISGLVKFGVGRARSAARRWPASTCRRRRSSSTRRASSTRSRSRRKHGVSPEQLRRARSEQILPRDTPGPHAARAGERGRERARTSSSTSCRTSCSSFGGIALFVGSVRDRELALDHDRPAHARVRDAAHARRVATAGARLGRARGARDRASLASVVGLFLGLGLATGLFELFDAVGFTLPNQGLVFQTRTIVVSLLVGDRS